LRSAEAEDVTGVSLNGAMSKLMIPRMRVDRISPRYKMPCHALRSMAILMPTVRPEAS
jgi:hypothetical protein